MSRSELKNSADQHSRREVQKYNTTKMVVRTGVRVCECSLLWEMTLQKRGSSPIDSLRVYSETRYHPRSPPASASINPGKTLDWDFIGVSSRRGESCRCTICYNARACWHGGGQRMYFVQVQYIQFAIYCCAHVRATFPIDALVFRACKFDEFHIYVLCMCIYVARGQQPRGIHTGLSGSMICRPKKLKIYL